MKKAYKTAATLSSILLLIAGIAIYLTWQNYLTFLAEPMEINSDQSGFTLTIEKGSSFKSVASSLKRRGISTNTTYLDWYARTEGLTGKIKAGRYTFKTTPTPVTFLQRIVAGQVDLYHLTIVEGWNFRQMLAAVSRHEQIKQTLMELDDDEIMIQLGRAGDHPEGLFFPDTYHFPEATRDVDFFRRAMNTMSTRLQKAWDKRDENLPFKSPYEALILASIVEKETGVVHERAAIAGVFVRRLQKGMRLQTDPTVIYGLGDRFDGNLRRRDLKTDTPYNTYTRYGLPPTPIALPSKASIQAVLHPSPGNMLYFVARGDGTHQFSATLNEHNQAVAKYQLGEK